RSFVQLQGSTTAAKGDAQAVFLGGRDGALDPERLKRGEYSTAELFARSRPGATERPERTERPATTLRPPASERELISRWLSSRPGTNPDVDRALSSLGQSYLPAIPRKDNVASEQFCRPGSRLSAETVPKLLLWLDLLSVSASAPVESLDRDGQALV